MGLVPGSLIPIPSYVSPESLRLCSYTRILSYAPGLLLIGLLRLVSFSVWSAITDFLWAFYTYTIIQGLFEPEVGSGTLLCL